MLPVPGKDLKKILGVAFGIAVLIGGTIGVGILRTPGSIAHILPDYWLIIACWAFGGLYVLMGVGSYAELATMLPKAGGSFNYIKRAYGEYAGFLTGWYDYILNSIAPAFFCIVISEYLTVLIPALKGFETIIAISFLITFTLLHLSGIKNGSVTQQITSVIKVIFFVTFIICCFLASGYKPDPAASQLTPAIIKGGVLLAVIKSMQLVIGTYDGWMSVCFFAEEDKDPGKNIPRSLFTGALIVMVLYILINMAIFHVLPVASVANSPLAASDASQIVFGKGGALFITVLAIFSIISILNAYMMIPARILFGLSRDGFFIQKGTTLNKGGTPITALLISSLFSLILIIVGSFETLFSLAAFMSVIVMGLTFASVIRLRNKEPNLSRPYRAWGYPLTSILMILISVALFVAFAISDQKNLLIIAIITVISYPAFLVSHGKHGNTRN